MAAKKERIPKPADGLPVIRFSYNWNNKLHTNAFTTLRLWLPDIYVVGWDYSIQTGPPTSPTVWGCYKLQAAKGLYLNQINDYIAYLDTGYDADTCKGIIRTMYEYNETTKRGFHNIEERQLGLYLLVKQFIE